jgi:tyrosyl-tRNA synthetase
VLDAYTVEDNTNAIHCQIQKLFNNASHFIPWATTRHMAPVNVLNNYDWLSHLKLLEFLKDVGKLSRINDMIQRER